MNDREFRELCIDAVRAWYSECEEQHRPNNIYIVWQCKTLQNSKALVSTDKSDGYYFEVTYNGDKHEAYLDAYTKVTNNVIEIDKDDVFRALKD